MTLEDLRSKYPKTFSTKPNFYFECGEGWYLLIDEICTKIEAYNDSLEDVEMWVTASQIKEKFGGLRFYTYQCTDEICSCIDRAEDLSFKVCEVCGKEGSIRNIKGWMTTLCEHHSKQK